MIIRLTIIVNDFDSKASVSRHIRKVVGGEKKYSSFGIFNSLVVNHVGKSEAHLCSVLGRSRDSDERVCNSEVHSV